MGAPIFVLQRPASAAERAQAAERGEELRVIEIGEFPTLADAFGVWNSHKPKIAARVLFFEEGRGGGCVKEITRSGWGWS